MGKTAKTMSPARAYCAVLLAAVLAIAGVAACSLAAATPATEQTETTIRIRLPECDVAAQTDTDGFCRFTGPDIQHVGQVGEPSIPYKAVTVLLPPNAGLTTVKAAITGSRWAAIDGQYDIQPVPPLAPGDCENTCAVSPTDKAIVNGKNADVYNTDASFPLEPVRKVDTQVMRGWKMAQILYAPYAYNPVEKQIFQLSGNAIEITFERDLLKSSAASIDFTSASLIQEATVNFAEMSGEYGGFAVSADTGRYVIITTSAIQAASSSLANFVTSKEARGFTVQVVTEGTWQGDAGGDTGDAAAEHIRSWLQANWSALNIKYVLLIGNPNPATGDVPMKMCYPQDADARYPDCPTDFYYAELTSNWNSDGDGKYGEFDDDFSGNPPRAAEVAVGRIPYYGSITDLDHILLKIIEYETTPDSDISWRRNTLLPMKPSDGSTPGYQLGEEIKNTVLVPNGWTYQRVYDEKYSLPEPPAIITPCTVDNVTSAWNNSDFGAIFWWTHGSSTSASYIMDLGHAATLDDDHPGFTFQCSCRNGWPEASNNLGYSLLKNGCIATVSASRDSWYQPGQTSFAGTATNSGMTFEYSQRLIAGEMYAGDALNDLKLDVSPGFEELWMNYLDFNLYGCPAVGPSTSTPDQAAPSVVTYPAHSVATTAARLRANLTSLGTADNATVSFVWGTTLGGPYPNETTGQVMTGTGTFYHDSSSLTPGTTYYYQAKATGDGTTTGLEKSFTTLTTPPSVSTSGASSISATSATLNGSLTSLGTADNVTVSFAWGTTDGGPYPKLVTVVPSMTGTGAFSAPLSGPTPKTTYYYIAKAVGHGSDEGDQISFTTSTVPPSVTTGVASSLATTLARLNGNLTSKGTASTVSVSFQWGIASGVYDYETATEVKTTTGTFYFNRSGLTPGTTYYFRAKAVGDGPPVYGLENSFTTLTTPPSVLTNVPSNIQANAARLNGILSSKGTAENVTLSFQWGTTSGDYEYGTAPEVKNTTGTFYFDLSGLASDTSFYYRAKAVGHGETVYGLEENFTTGTTSPSVTTGAAIDITTTSATLNGSLTSKGTADNVTVSFEWKPSGGSYTPIAVGVRDSTGTFSVGLTSLTPGTTYYFKAKADGDGDPVYGEEKSFTTLRVPLIANVNPGTGMSGQSMVVGISGSDFAGVTNVSFGPEIIVDSFTLVSDTQMSATILLCDATPGVRDVSVTTLDGTATLIKGFSITDSPPNQPQNAAPVDKASVMTLTPTLGSSAFSHPCLSRTHTVSQWQVATVSGDYSNPLFNSAADSINLTSMALPRGVVGEHELYWWRVRYRDNRGIWSDWSTETSFARPDFLRAGLNGSAEIRVLDSRLRVTGTVGAQPQQQIPYSDFFSDTVTVVSPTDSYRYEVVGTEGGSYTLTVTSVAGDQNVVFHATGIPVSAGEVHQYVIDWDALSRGEPGVIIRIDTDADGTFEKTALVKGEIGGKEFVTAMNRHQTPVWVWICLCLGLLAATSGVFVLSRIAGKKPQADVLPQ